MAEPNIWSLYALIEEIRDRLDNIEEWQGIINSELDDHNSLFETQNDFNKIAYNELVYLKNKRDAI